MERMTPRNAIKRIGWRFSEAAKRQDKSFRINQDDISALESIAKFYQDKEKQAIVDNQLFGKLYIYLFGQFVNYYQSTALDDIPQKELHKLLDKDLRTIVQEVTDNLNLYELKNSIEAQKHKDYKPMEYSEVAENLKIMVNGALNTYTR